MSLANRLRSLEVLVTAEDCPPGKASLANVRAVLLDGARPADVAAGPNELATLSELDQHARLDRARSLLGRFAPDGSPER